MILRRKLINHIFEAALILVQMAYTVPGEAKTENCLFKHLLLPDKDDLSQITVFRIITETIHSCPSQAGLSEQAQESNKKGMSYAFPYLFLAAHKIPLPALFSRTLKQRLVLSYLCWVLLVALSGVPFLENQSFLFLLFFFFKKFLIKLQLIYNIVSISAVQQSDPVIHIYILFLMLFSIMFYHKRLDIVPCAVQQGSNCQSTPQPQQCWI